MSHNGMASIKLITMGYNVINYVPTECYFISCFSYDQILNSLIFF